MAGSLGSRDADGERGTTLDGKDEGRVLSREKEKGRREKGGTTLKAEGRRSKGKVRIR
jgi:hypothetical protein